MPSALTASVLLLQYSSQIPGNSPCHAHDLYISRTIHLRAPLVKLFCPASNFAFQGKDFATVHGSVAPPDSDLELVLHVVPLQSPRPRLELLASIVTARSLNVVLTMLQDIHGVVHPSVSC